MEPGGERHPSPPVRGTGRGVHAQLRGTLDRGTGRLEREVRPGKCVHSLDGWRGAYARVLLAGPGEEDGSRYRRPPGSRPETDSRLLTGDHGRGDPGHACGRRALL